MATAPYEQDERQSAAAAPGVLWALLTPAPRSPRPHRPGHRPAGRRSRRSPTVSTASPNAAARHRDLQQPGQDARRRTRRQRCPVVWTEGTLGGPRGRRFAAALAELVRPPGPRRRTPRGARRAQGAAGRAARRRRRPRRLLPRPRRGGARPARTRRPAPRPPARRPQRRPRRPRTGPRPRHGDQ